ncbi:hypothetical protein DY000_02022917 [Brassica cretica]|uniref:Uncharacterized protein n=1 Tax=Brassica cretica TaxID=69181 RepID=A0ABQ7EHQ0_BRACR|nr:hypothetical protein DY000_02022917 [Brassica cretica]
MSRLQSAPDLTEFPPLVVEKSTGSSMQREVDAVLAVIPEGDEGALNGGEDANGGEEDANGGEEVREGGSEGGKEAEKEIETQQQLLDVANVNETQMKVHES